MLGGFVWCVFVVCVSGAWCVRVCVCAVVCFCVCTLGGLSVCVLLHVYTQKMLMSNF